MSENRAVRRWPIAVIRVLAMVVLVQVLTQAALAGGFITGNVNLLGLHSANAILLILTASALLPAAILLVRPGRGPWWPIVFSVVLWWAITIQVGFGFGRQIGLHIPLGMAIMGLIAAFTWWAFAYRPTRSRSLSSPPQSSALAVATRGAATADIGAGEPAFTDPTRRRSS